MAYVAYIDSKVVLIDVHQLAELMIDFNVGLATGYCLPRQTP